MSEIVNEATIKVVADASGVETGLRPAVDAARRAGQAVAQTGERAAGSARAVEAAQRSIIASIQRTTLAMEAGGRGTAAYYEQMANQRLADPTALTPYLNRLKEVEAAQRQATESARTQAGAERELAQARETKASFVAGLREQIALFGKSTEEVLRYRAAQAGASQESAMLILQLQNMRAAHEQVASAARAQATADREAAQLQANKESFLAGLREQVALFGRSADEVLRYRAAQAGAAQEAAQLIAQLQNMRSAQEQVEAAARAAAAAQREAAQNQANKDSFLAGLREQIALFGKSTDEVLRYRAAQAGVTQEAAQLIAQLQGLRVAQEQVEAAAKAASAAQRDAAQIRVNKESFLSGLREQIALSGKSTEEVLRYRAAQAGAGQEAAHLILQLQNVRAAQEQVTAAARAAATAQREIAQAEANKNSFLQGLREQIQLFGLSADEVNRYRAAQLGAATAADPLIAKLRDLRLAQEQAAYGAQMEAQAQREAAQARATQDSFLKGLQSQAQAIGKTRIELLELQAAQLGLTTQAKPFIDQLRAADQNMRNGGMSAAAMAAALRGVPAQLTDIIVSLQGGQAPLTVFLQQGGQLRDMFGSIGGAARALGSAALGLITPYTVAAAAILTGAAAFKAGHDESIRYSRALADTNNIAGTTSAQMNDMARNIGAVAGSQREGARALTALAATGAITRQNLEWFGTVAVEAQHVLNKSVEDTAKEFAELGKSPLTALQSISEKYHFITAATYAQVKAAQEQGRTIEAANIAQQAYAQGISEQRQKVLDSLTDWERGWLRIKKAVSSSVDSVIDFVGGRQTGPQEQIDGLLKQTDALEARIARLKKAGAEREGAQYNPANDRQVLTAQASLDATVREINAIREKGQAKKDAAQADAAQIRADELRNKWLGERNIILTRSEQMTRDLQAAETEGRQNNLSDAEIQDRLMVVRRKYNDVYVDGIDRSLTALRRRGEVENALSQRVLAQIQAQRDAGEITEEEAVRRTAAQQLAQMDRERAGLQAQLGLVKNKISSRREQLDLEGQIATLEVQRASRAIQLETDLTALKRTRAQASEENYLAGITAAEAELKSIKDLVDAQVVSNAEIGLSKAEIGDLTAMRLLAAAAAKEQTAAELANFEGGKQAAEIYRQQAAELRKLAAAGKAGGEKQDVADASKKALEELNQFLDPSKAQTFGEALREAFGSAGDSLSKLTATLDGFGKRQAEISKHRATADAQRGKGDFDEIKYLQTITELNKRRTQDQLSSYGSMAGAAAGFFGEQSKGYQALMTVSKVFHAAELAMTVAELVPKGISAVLGQAQGDPYSAFGRMAAMAAIVAGLGVAIGGVGGSGPSASETRQKAQGTGTVLGSDAKSESISRSLDLIEKATFQGLGISNNMLDALRNIESGIGAFASQLVGSTDVGKVDVGQLNSNNGGGTTAFGVGAGAAIGSYFGPIGTAIGAVVGLLAKNIPVIGKIATSIFGGKETLQDSGLSIGKIDYESILAGRLDAMKYAEVKVDGGWFKKDKTKTRSEDLGDDAERQITGILTSMYESVFEAGKMLGLGADEFSDKLDSFVVDIGEISLKGLSGEEVQKELEAVFSKVGDQLAAYGVSGLGDFQKVGEGYLETLTRVATGYQTVTVVADALGMTFDSVGLGSIAARECLIDLAGGLDEFTSSAEQFLSDFYTEKEQADALRARLQPTLDKFGIQTGADDSIEQFRDVVKNLKLATADGAQDFATLMAVMPAFKQLADFDKAKFEERLELQGQLDELTLSSAQLLLKQRDALDASNRSLFDQVKAAERSREIADERKSLQDQLDDLMLSAAQLLNKQREALDASNRSLFDQIEAIKQANKIADERKGLQNEYDQLTMTSEQLLRKQRDALDSSNRALFDQIQAVKSAAAAQEEATKAAKQRGADLLAGVDSQFAALQSVVGREKALLQDVANKHKALADSLRSTLDSLSVSGQEKESRAAAQAQITAALAIAKASGTLPDVDSLKGALSIVSKDSASLFSTQEEYLRDFYSTQADIADLAGLTDKTLSVEEQSIKRLDDILANAQQQVNALKGLDTTMLTLVDVMRGFDLAIGEAQKDPVASAGANLAKLYKELLGRAPDAGGLEFYKARLAEGVTLEQIRADILQSVEYKKHMGIPGFAGGGFFGGGYRIVGENGPELEATGPARIFNASQTSGMLARLARPSEDYAALLAEVRVLRAALGGLFPVLYQVAKNTGRGANSLEKMDRREEAVK